MNPLPLPYTLHSDDTVALLLLGCFLLSAYILSRSRKFLYLLVKDFLLNRERNSIFATSTSADMRYLLLLVVQTCVLAALLLYACLCGSVAQEVAGRVPTLLAVGLLTGVLMLALALKWAVYSLAGWVFFRQRAHFPLAGILFNIAVLRGLRVVPRGALCRVLRLERAKRCGFRRDCCRFVQIDDIL